MPTADEYRRLAAECLALAPRISTDLRALFIALAQGWMDLADYLEEDDSILADPTPAVENNGLARDTGDIGEDWVE